MLYVALPHAARTPSSTQCACASYAMAFRTWHAPRRKTRRADPVHPLRGDAVFCWHGHSARLRQSPGISGGVASVVDVLVVILITFCIGITMNCWKALHHCHLNRYNTLYDSL